MTGEPFPVRTLTTAHHRTAWIEVGAEHGPLMIFLHGWPELGLLWRAQLEHFAARGWRCLAPDMRGYGGSSAPDAVSAYSVREIVADMVELHEVAGAAPALWVGHDWGSAIAWSIAAQHPERCRGVANLCIPYFARGMTLDTLTPLVDRDRYPADRYPVGQWDYWLYHREQFTRSARDLEADVSGTITALYRTGSADAAGKPSPLATTRARGGWFGADHRAPAMPPDEALLGEADFKALVAAFERTGFSGSNAWYLNDVANADYAAQAPAFGRLSCPALFIHAAWDATCDTVHGRLAEPMRDDCLDLTEATIQAGHEVMLERPAETNAVMADWLTAKGLSA